MPFFAEECPLSSEPSFAVIEDEEDQKGGGKSDQHEEPGPTDGSLFIFSGDDAELFSSGIAQNEDEEAEKKKKSNVEYEGFHDAYLAEAPFMAETTLSGYGSN